MVIRLDRNEFNPPAEFQLICIASTLKEYRLAHLINVTLRSELKRESDLNDEVLDGELPLYANFLWDDTVAFRTVQLLGNRPLVRQETTRSGDLFGSEAVVLLVPDLPKVDYMLLFTGNFEAEEVDGLRERLNDISGVTLAYVCDPATIKDITPLQF